MAHRESFDSTDKLAADTVLGINFAEFGGRHLFVREATMKQDAALFERLSGPFAQRRLSTKKVGMFLVKHADSFALLDCENVIKNF